jgi:hypothetical protein
LKLGFLSSQQLGCSSPPQFPLRYRGHQNDPTLPPQGSPPRRAVTNHFSLHLPAGAVPRCLGLPGSLPHSAAPWRSRAPRPLWPREFLCQQTCPSSNVPSFPASVPTPPPPPPAARAPKSGKGTWRRDLSPAVTLSPHSVRATRVCKVRITDLVQSSKGPNVATRPGGIPIRAPAMLSSSGTTKHSWSN